MSTSNLPEVKQKLFEWAQTISGSYKPPVIITDFTSSWQNGVAFGAIAHYYQPDLLDFEALDPADSIGNLDKAFQAFKMLGITSVLNPEEVANHPDEQAIRTYLLGLHSHLSKRPRRVSRLRDHRRKKSGTKMLKEEENHLNGLFSPEMVVKDVKPDITFKVIMLGDSAVGKSTLFERWRSNLFQQTTTTVGMELWTKTYSCDGKNIQIQLWDTAGQELYRAVTKSYYREAMGALLVYDITKMETYQHVSSWFKEFQAVNNIENLPILMIGNKSDLEQERTVSEQEANSFASTHGFLFMETSARHGNEVQRAFQILFQEIYKIQAQNPTNKQETTTLTDSFDPKPRSGFDCC